MTDTPQPHQSKSGSGADRRAFVRLSKSLEVHYKIIKNASSPKTPLASAEVRSTTKDISAGGLSFYLKEKIPLFSILEIRLSVPGSPADILCLAEVVRSRQVENTPFCDTAVCFLDMSNHDRLILDKFVLKETK